MLTITITDLIENLKSIPYFKELNMTKMLMSIDFFSDVDKKILDEISGLIVFREYEKDEIICRHGKFDTHFYYILSGKAHAVIPTEDNPKYELFTLGAGDFFGEELIFSNTPRENTVVATEEMFVITIESEILRMLFDASSHIKAVMDEKYIERKLKRDLRSIPVFTNLSDKIFSRVLDKLQLISISENEEIFKENDPGDSFYLIRVGEVNVFNHVNGKKHLIAILGEGQFFGEMALVADEKRNATVVTSKKTDLVILSRDDFLGIMKKDESMVKEISRVIEKRITDRANALKSPNAALINRKLLDLNKEVNLHLDILSQCTVDTEYGSALLATLPGSRYPYVYPRDSACASRFLYKLVMTDLKVGDIALRHLGEISRFIMNCQREDGYWGQRYGVDAKDNGIYLQEDNVAHGVTILCRYLLAAKKKNVKVTNLENIVKAISKGSEFARKNYYRNEIHLFYSTTSIHESAIEEGYSIWVNSAYLLMLRLMERIGKTYDVLDHFKEEMNLKPGFEITVNKVFSLSDRYVRRLRPDGVVDLRPDITLMSPFFFGTGLERKLFVNNETFFKFLELYY